MPEPETPPHVTGHPRRIDEEHFAQLVSEVQDYAVFLLDPEGRVETWNAGARRIKGYEAQEIMGKHISIFYPDDALARNWPQLELETAERCGRFSDEGWRIRKDGSRMWASVVITALKTPEGKLRGFLKITRDLTERRKSEEVLRQSEERFRLLVEGVRDYAIFMLDPQGYVMSWNIGAERIKGFKATEIIGKHFSTFYPPDALAAGKPKWELETAVLRGRVEDEGWRVKKNGDWFWANAVITALHGHNGELRGFAKVTRDLTERRKIDMLLEADRQKDNFLATLAHELRNPLAPIRNSLYVMNRPDAVEEDREAAYQMAERQLQQMSGLVNDLLDVAAISQGQIQIKRERLLLQEFLTSAIAVAQPMIEERDHKLTVTTPPGPLYVELDPLRMGQVLSNLLTNAAKYTDPQGKITVACTVDGQMLTIRVKDNGLGIDPAVLPRIFDLFYQGERRMDRGIGGLGIGLSLVKRITEMHGGRAEVFSEGYGLGSEFVLRLPDVVVPLTDRPEHPPQTREPGNGDRGKHSPRL